MLILTGGPRDVAWVWFGPDGRTLTACSWGGDARRWRLDAPGRPEPASWQRPADPRGEVVELPPRGNEDRYGYRVGSGVAELPPRACPRATAVLADGTRFVAAEEEYGEAGSGQVRSWLAVRSLADGAELLRLPARYASMPRLAAVPFSARVVGTAGGRLLVWDCDAGTTAEVAEGRKLFKDVAAHPAGRAVAAVRNTPAVLLLDPHTAAEAGGLTLGVGGLAAVAYSPDGLLGAAAGDRGRVAVWDADG